MTARPRIQLFSDLLMVAFGLGISLLQLLGGDASVESAVPLVCVGFGAIWLTVMTDVVRPLRRSERDAEQAEDAE